MMVAISSVYHNFMSNCHSSVISFMILFVLRFFSLSLQIPTILNHFKTILCASALYLKYLEGFLIPYWSVIFFLSDCLLTHHSFDTCFQSDTLLCGRDYIKRKTRTRLPESHSLVISEGIWSAQENSIKKVKLAQSVGGIMEALRGTKEQIQ